MPERGFDTGFWTDDFVMGLTYPAKLLFHYLGSNDHCNQAGVYHIAPKTIIFETGLPESDLPSLLKMLYPEVKWLPEENIVWVKNFIAHQAKSPKFLVAAGNCLKKIRNNGLVAEVLEYNLTYHTLSIPYEYPTDRVSILPVSVSSSKSVSSSSSDEGRGMGRRGVVKGGKELSTGKDIPRSRTEAEETLCEGDREVISVWCSVKGFNMTPADASALVARLRTEFPGLDILAQSKVWVARKLSEPLTKNSRPSQQIWNWMVKGREIAQERRQHEQVKGQRVKGSRPASDFRGRNW